MAFMECVVPAAIFLVNRKYVCFLSTFVAISTTFFLKKISTIFLLVFGCALLFSNSFISIKNVNKIFYLEKQGHVLTRKVLINYGAMANTAVCFFVFLLECIHLLLNSIKISKKYKKRKKTSKGIVGIVFSTIISFSYKKHVEIMIIFHTIMLLFYFTFIKVFNVFLVFVRFKICIISIGKYLVGCVIFGISIILFEMIVNVAMAILKYNYDFFDCKYILLPNNFLREYCKEDLNDLFDAAEKTKNEYLDMYKIVVPKGTSQDVKVVKCIKYTGIFYYIAYVIKMKLYKIRANAILSEIELSPTQREESNSKIEKLNEETSVKFNKIE